DPSTAAERQLAVAFGYAGGPVGCEPQRVVATVSPAGAGGTVIVDQAGPDAATHVWTCATVMLLQDGAVTDAVHGTLVDGNAKLRVHIPDIRKVKLNTWKSV